MKVIKGISQTNLIIIVAAIVIIVLVALFLGQRQFQPTPQTATPTQTQVTTPAVSTSAKGVVAVESPQPRQTIRSPLLVKGVVYVNSGRLTIRLKQKESGVEVTQAKIVQISGQADRIGFAEAIQFGLPARPQSGILEVEFKDATGQGADDLVSVEVEFPTDLGPGR